MGVTMWFTYSVGNLSSPGYALLQPSSAVTNMLHLFFSFVISSSLNLLIENPHTILCQVSACQGNWKIPIVGSRIVSL